MDYLSAQKQEDLQSLKASLFDQKNEIVQKLGNATKAEEKALNKELQACTNTLMLVSEYSDYKKVSPGALESNKRKSFKTSLGKSKRKSAEKYLTKHKDSIYQDRLKAVQEGNLEAENGRSDEYFVGTIREGAYKNFSSENPAPENWDAELTEQRSKWCEENDAKGNNLSEKAISFSVQFNQLKSDNNFEPGGKYELTKDQKKQLGFEDSDRTVNGLLRTVHFDKKGQPITDRDKMNHISNLMTKKALLSGNDDELLGVFQSRTREFLNLNLPSDGVDTDFILKNPELKMECGRIGALVEVEKRWPEMEKKFPKCHAFIKKYYDMKPTEKTKLWELFDKKVGMAGTFNQMAGDLLSKENIKAANLAVYGNGTYEQDLVDGNIQALNTFKDDFKKLENEL